MTEPRQQPGYHRLPAGTVLGYRWPRLSACKRCHGTHARVLQTVGRIQWRRCADCKRRYKVIATHADIADGCGLSRIEQLGDRR